MATQVEVSALAAAHSDGALVLDVREPAEYEAGHVPNAKLVPLGELSARSAELPRNRRLHLICASGHRSAAGAELLTRAGFDAVSVAGGTQAWRQAGYPVVFGPRAGAA